MCWQPHPRFLAMLSQAMSNGWWLLPRKERADEPKVMPLGTDASKMKEYRVDGAERSEFLWRFEVSR